MHGWRRVGAAVLVVVGCAHAPAETAAAPAPVSRCAARMSPTSEGEHGVTGALAQLDAQLRAAHQAARVEACGRLGEERLVIRWAFGKLEARWRGQLLTPEGLDVIPASYHPLKDVAHAVLLASLLFEAPPGPARDQKVAAAIAAIDAVLAEVDGAGPASRLIPPEQIPRQGRMLELTRAALVKLAAGGLPEAERRQYFAAVRPDVVENLRVVAEELLRNLDREVKEIRRKAEAQDPRAWDSVLVLAASVHQARARELGVQYFERLLAEPVGEGARNERRLVVSEGVFAEADQYGLLALHLVDQAASADVFGDPLRLQWDALGDPGGALDAVLPR
ncbi:MAG TPA: hypothetical protein VFA20_09170 [Myxococcaceae bacterium]|nr:hypothetical protein [Myxococcaceae bacterium]